MGRWSRDDALVAMFTATFKIHQVLRIVSFGLRIYPRVLVILGFSSFITQDGILCWRGILE